MDYILIIHFLLSVNLLIPKEGYIMVINNQRKTIGLALSVLLD